MAVGVFLILFAGRNHANQLRLVVYPVIYDGFFTSQRTSLTLKDETETWPGK